jgi:hypothetical protein
MRGGSSFYEVDKILRALTNKNGEIRYLVKWKGWDIKDSTWEPE